MVLYTIPLLTWRMFPLAADMRISPEFFDTVCVIIAEIMADMMIVVVMNDFSWSFDDFDDRNITIIADSIVMVSIMKSMNHANRIPLFNRLISLLKSVLSITGADDAVMFTSTPCIINADICKL